MTVTHLNKIIPEGLSSLHPLFGQAFEEMSRLCRENAPDGHYEIEGDKLFINVMTYSTKPESDSLFETHRDYVDIQMMMEGKEIIGFAPVCELTVSEPYKPDCELYGMIDAYDSVCISGDKLCVIFPEEPHAPGIAIDGTPATVKKMVAKIKVR